MERTRLENLQKWLISPARKPLVVRGARQVGKTWIVRRLAEITNKTLIEINFEKNSRLVSLFESEDMDVVFSNLSTYMNQKISADTCLLFLDEIQVVPQLFAKLRWFAEDLPQLPVIAAGSLLEFVLAEHTFSMPVGRIQYMHIEPLSFEEYLLARGNAGLYQYVMNFTFDKNVPEEFHEKLIEIFNEYMLIGGMPAVVDGFLKENDLAIVSQMQHDLINTYRDDFSKYQGRMALSRIEDVMNAVPKLLGEKFVFSKVNKDVQAPPLKQGLMLLERARVVHIIRCTSGNGVPLASEVIEKYFKTVLLDTGLCSAILGLNMNQFNNMTSSLSPIHRGGLAEQVVGQILRTVMPYYQEPSLFYWQKTQEAGNAEIDYLLEFGGNVYPLEVKSGSTGGMKSLHIFMALKKYKHAIRVNSDNPSLTNVKINAGYNQEINYQLMSIPFYLLGQIYRLIATQFINSV